MPELPQLEPLERTAKRLGIHPRTLRRHLHRGDVPGEVVVGRLVMVNSQMLAEWIASGGAASLSRPGKTGEKRSR